MIIKDYKKETKTTETLTQAKSMTESQSPQRSRDFIPGISGCALSWCTQAVHNSLPSPPPFSSLTFWFYTNLSHVPTFRHNILWLSRIIRPSEYTWISLTWRLLSLWDKHPIRGVFPTGSHQDYEQPHGANNRAHHKKCHCIFPFLQRASVQEPVREFCGHNTLTQASTWW